MLTFECTSQVFTRPVVLNQSPSQSENTISKREDQQQQQQITRNHSRKQQNATSTATTTTTNNNNDNVLSVRNFFF